VWLARDEQSGLDVALKIVPREGKAAARAEREAAAASRLRHPSCLRAYAFARDPRHVYIAYEYVPGRTLRELLRAGELDDARAIEAAAQICDGLAHAHGAGILHRDVKPSNVLLAEDTERVSARLLDFGLARMQEAETLTAQGDVPGTLAYISPERLRGERATQAADVWAVGVMLWEALAGRHPFWTGSMLDTARAIEDGAPPLAELRPDLPKPLLAAVDRSLSPDAARRPSALELAHALRSGAAARRRRSRPSAQADRWRGLGGTGRFPRRRALPNALVHKELAHVAGAAQAAVFAGWSALALPFFPTGWWVGIGLLAGAVTFVRARLGLAAALAVPVLPLGNISFGLAVAYGIVALAWLVLAAGEPRWGLVAALGPLLGPVAALGLLPLACLGLRSPVRRAIQCVTGVLLAAVAAGLAHDPLPFTGARPPLGLGVAGADDPFAVGGSLLRAALAQQALATEALMLAAVAVVLPVAAGRGRWGAAAAGAFLVAGTLLAVPGAAALPLVLAGWAIAVVLTLRPKAAT
jgi:hypothetical protein